MAAIIGMHATKLVVGDLPAAEAFYTAIGLKLVTRNSGGEGNVRQDQAWLSPTGASDAHMLILSHFPEAAPAPAPVYPGEVWLAFNVADVAATCEAVVAAGGSVFRAPEDQPAYGVSAAVVRDNEGHVIEIVGPMCSASGPVPDPLAFREEGP